MKSRTSRTLLAFLLLLFGCGRSVPQIIVYRYEAPQPTASPGLVGQPQPAPPTQPPAVIVQPPPVYPPSSYGPAPYPPGMPYPYQGPIPVGVQLALANPSQWLLVVVIDNGPPMRIEPYQRTGQFTLPPGLHQIHLMMERPRGVRLRPRTFQIFAQPDPNLPSVLYLPVEGW